MTVERSAGLPLSGQSALLQEISSCQLSSTLHSLQVRELPADNRSRAMESRRVGEEGGVSLHRRSHVISSLLADGADVQKAFGFFPEIEVEHEAAADSQSEVDQRCSSPSLVPHVSSSQPILLQGAEEDDAESQMELDRAIALSLAEQKGECTTVLGKSGLKRKRGDAVVEAPGENTPHAAGATAVAAPSKAVANTVQCQAGWPAGITNIGNSCWFGAIIQSLFHLPSFRDLVLQHTIPDGTMEMESIRDEDKGRKFQPPLVFLSHLKELFSQMMVASTSPVDPSHSISSFSQGFAGAHTQQDVSEVTHRLLDWLEEAFSNGQYERNPMVDLFYGQCLVLDPAEESGEGRLEAFGQLPLQVAGFSCLHDSLQATLWDGEGREHWLTRLPPVLTFDLSRFAFDAVEGRAQKLHHRLEFPQHLYMDRYILSNREIVQLKRDETRRLLETQGRLQQQLARFAEFGSGPRHFPLWDVLQYALEFSTTVPRPTEEVLSNPSSPTFHKQFTPSVSPLPPTTSSGNEPPARTPSPVAHQSSSSPSIPTFLPIPLAGSKEERSQVSFWLSEWLQEVRADVQELQEGICRLQRAIDTMYTQPTLQKFSYRLHSVLVHEGQAQAGHYWAFVGRREWGFSGKRADGGTEGNAETEEIGWRRFNDVRVSEASWEEVQREGCGGEESASAYCLLYVAEKDNEESVGESDVESEGEKSESLSSLPRDLRLAVPGDSASEGPGEVPSEASPAQAHIVGSNDVEVEVEIKESEVYGTSRVQEDLEDRDQKPCASDEIKVDETKGTSQLHDSATTTGSNNSDVNSSDVTVSTDESTELSFQLPMEEIAEEESPAMQGVLLALTKTSNLYQSHGPEAALIEAFRSEYSRLVVLANSDNRFTTSTQPSTGNQPTNTTYPRFKDSSAQIDGSTSQLVGESKQTHTTSSSTTCVDPSTKNIFLPLHTPSATPSSPCTNSAVDLRLEHVLVYLLRAGAPKKVVERSLLEAFASPALSQHPWCVQVMRVAQARLKEIRPEDMDLDEYQRWLNAYASFRKAAAFLHSGLVLFLQKR
uniref:ubiquitin carboxyl-terminal hydrolase 28-like n=1 Tax=Myxine glutinosa TaxID=7769 RepID=UPI00359021C7